MCNYPRAKQDSARMTKTDVQKSQQGNSKYAQMKQHSSTKAMPAKKNAAQGHKANSEELQNKKAAPHKNYGSVPSEKRQGMKGTKRQHQSPSSKMLGNKPRNQTPSPTGLTKPPPSKLKNTAVSPLNLSSASSVAYAGAKYHDPPSPAMLPKPPVHWMCDINTIQDLEREPNTCQQMTTSLKMMLNVQA